MLKELIAFAVVAALTASLGLSLFTVAAIPVAA
jgi:hypothetical protein